MKFDSDIENYKRLVLNISLFRLNILTIIEADYVEYSTPNNMNFLTNWVISIHSLLFHIILIKSPYFRKIMIFQCQQSLERPVEFDFALFLLHVFYHIPDFPYTDHFILCISVL